MNKLKHFGVFMLAFMLSSFVANSQISEKGITSLKEGTIQEKFQFIKDESNSYLDNKVVKLTFLNQLEAIVRDSLNEQREAIAALSAAQRESKDSVEAFKEKIALAENAISEAEKDRDSVSFLGAPMNKSTYSFLMWTLILILLGSVIYLIYSGKDDRNQVENIKKSQLQLQEEYDGFRKRALDREQKLKRELMDERNRDL